MRGGRADRPALTRPIGVVFGPRRPQVPAVRHFLELLETSPDLGLDLAEGAEWTTGAAGPMKA
ncbi:hypothetical protein E1293_40500 [Actinomadura darangshiensis]|uniref:Uncharacterized protein n=1 Tax=Actinomadura darangshiensis TaxID=705336 RepID=A0A4R5A0G9_9ACTN|nr:hypothetical protein [Actinomadura darangshiensis]TDD65248.1 hypothetical protein E1293_40500 [Actinomadura darangshiensis]